MTDIQVKNKNEHDIIKVEVQLRSPAKQKTYSEKDRQNIGRILKSNFGPPRRIVGNKLLTLKHLKELNDLSVDAGLKHTLIWDDFLQKVQQVFQRNYGVYFGEEIHIACLAPFAVQESRQVEGKSHVSCFVCINWYLEERLVLDVPLENFLQLSVSKLHTQCH
jgi:hypothetical protein